MELGILRYWPYILTNTLDVVHQMAFNFKAINYALRVGIAGSKCYGLGGFYYLGIRPNNHILYNQSKGKQCFVKYSSNIAWGHGKIGIRLILSYFL